MIEGQAINCKSGKIIPCQVDTICLYGDRKTAVSLASRLREGLIKEGIDLKKIRSTFKNKIKKGGPKDRPFSLIILINYLWAQVGI